MTHPPQRSEAPLQIHKPCPKSWSQLVGDERRRFCSECSLHVHNAEELTRNEAQALVSEARGRVCMRVSYDPSGAPIFRDSAPAVASAAPRPASPGWARWALSAAAGLLAACYGSTSTPASGDPAVSDPAQTATKMGKVCSTVLGDVALPRPDERELMGEATLTDSAPAPSSGVQPASDE